MIGTLLGRFWREISALVAGVVAVAALYLKGRRDARREVERKALKRRVEAQEKADVEAANYRADGASKRLRDGNY